MTLMSDLDQKKISEIATVVSGTSPKGGDINDAGLGVPFYQGSKEFGSLHPRPERFTEHPVKTALAGDILISVRAPVGRINIADTDCAIGRGVMAVRPKNPADQTYLAAVLGAMGAEWDSHASDGTMFSNLSKPGLENMKIDWPEDRGLIGELLDALTGKIEANRQLVDSIGRLIVDECHLAFERREGQDEISLVEAVRLVNGGAFTKDASQTGRMVIRIKELNSGPSESTIYNSISVPPEKTSYPGDVLFAWSGSLGVWRWYQDEAIINQHIFKVLPKAHPVWLGWVHILNSLVGFQDIAAGKATTMGHITKDHLTRARVPKLSAAELDALTANVEPLWDYQVRIGQEMHSLIELREFVIPRLLVGDLQVASVEKDLEEAR